MPLSVALATHACFLAPPALVAGVAREQRLAACSVKALALPGQQRLSLLLLGGQDGTTCVFEAPVPRGAPLASFVLPPSALARPGVLTAYLVACEPGSGRIGDVVDSGQVLVLPADATPGGRGGGDGSPNGSSSSVASGSEILRRLAALQQARAEQQEDDEVEEQQLAPEEGYLQAPQSLARRSPAPGSSAWSRLPEPAAPLARVASSDSDAAFASARSSWENSQPSKAAGCSSSAAACDNEAAHGDLPAAPLAEQLPVLLRSGLCGFPDRCLERSYLGFKTASCAMLDTTAFVICFGMLVASTMRSVDPTAPGAPAILAVMLLYGCTFFLPYAAMHAHRGAFLARREQLLVAGRCLSAAVLMLVALGCVPRPAAWATAVTRTFSMQLQNGLILPACQQVRLPAAAVIAALHLPSDALMFALGRPFPVALGHSWLVQCSALLVTLGLDVWCRQRFVRAYPAAGAALGALEARHRHQQAHGHAFGPAGAAACKGRC